MNIEKLQSKSDVELNELAAFKVMEWKCDDEEFPESFTHYLTGDGKRGYMEWFPTGKMDDAMELVEKLRSQSILLNMYSLSTGYGVASSIDSIGLVEGESLSRCITTAAILSKSENP